MICSVASRFSDCSGSRQNLWPSCEVKVIPCMLLWRIGAICIARCNELEFGRDMQLSPILARTTHVQHGEPIPDTVMA